MTKTEVGKIMAVLKGTYPQFYRGMSKESAAATIGIWHEMFEGEPYDIVASAVKTYIASDTTGYPPAIGQIKEKIRLLTAAPEMSEIEAWGLVRKAAMKGDKKKAFDELPEIVQQCVGSPTILRDWGRVDIERFNTVIASNFMRVYRIQAQRKSEIDKIPLSVKRALPELNRLFLLEGEE